MGVRDEISELITEFCKAVDNQDAQAVASFYADGIRFLPPDAPMIEGRSGVQGFVEQMFGAGMRSLDLATLDVLEGGDLAVETGRFTMGFEGDAKVDGKYVAVWGRQSDGSLKLVVDTFNTDAPPAS